MIRVLVVIYYLFQVQGSAAFTRINTRVLQTNAPTRLIRDVTNDFAQCQPSRELINFPRLRHLSSSSSDEDKKSNLPMLLDPGTRGGAVFLSLVLLLVPFLAYEILTVGFGLDEIDTGRYIGVGFTVFTCALWASTYFFRVATKDMTYAKQLKDYEDAVIAKRLEELDDDEVQALVEDIERDNF